MRTRTSSGRAVPAFRGVLLGALSAALSVTAHGVAGGGLPHPATTVVLASLLGWIATGTAHRTQGPLGIVFVLGTGQLGTHTLLTLLSGHGGEGPAMVAGHALATVATACALAHAEAALAGAAAAARWLVPRVALLPWWALATRAPMPPVRTATPLPLPDAVTTVVGVLLRRVHGRRGPPALS